MLFEYLRFASIELAHVQSNRTERCMIQLSLQIFEWKRDSETCPEIGTGFVIKVPVPNRREEARAGEVAQPLKAKKRGGRKDPPVRTDKTAHL